MQALASLFTCGHPRGRGFESLLLSTEKQNEQAKMLVRFVGGGRGIRTPVGFHPNGFQDRLVMTASIFLHVVCQARIIRTVVKTLYFWQILRRTRKRPNRRYFQWFLGKTNAVVLNRTTSEFLPKGAEIAAIWQGLYYSCLAYRLKV